MGAGQAVTMMDVARAAGVSRAAVSKVIRDAYGVSPEMRARVESAIARLGYRPSVAARAIRGSSFTIGFELHEIENPALSRILHGTVAEIEGTGYQLVVAPAMAGVGESPQAINALVDLRVDGLVVVAPHVPSGLLEELALRVPVVLLSRHHHSENYDTVTGDDAAGARLVMRHLISLGHDRIAYLTRGGEAAARECTPPTVRLEVYLHEMKGSGRGRHIEVVRADSALDARRVTSELLASAARPTAIFAANDDLALEALHVVQERGLSASDLSVVGYDNVRLAGHPGVSLTTIDQSGDELGRRAVRLLLDRIGGRTEARREMTTPRLIVRNSTGRPRSGQR
ncbi:LacI family DNA-binding transcriptional regulator [Saccharopolyspora pogona]|uniref:LacI family DNA-binding transcriptional regulator n=1 Tax=Saccharopolyspora pogona TaxID=333966 RepID=UPI001CC25A7C|nr:LacI family DNA-binding transcriptional regulator [Saccharopolyspora pogona]